MAEPLVSFEAVDFAYPRQSVPVLAAFSYALRPGKRVGVVGQSGCGKSTLVRLITGRLRPVSGSITLHRSVDPRRGGHYGLIAQSDALFPWRSVQSNILAALPERATPDERSDVARSLERLGLPAELLHRFPESLSVGMRKRVEICRAALRPSLMVLADEPFAALDVATADASRTWLIDKVTEAAGSLLLVSHDLRVVAETCEEILVFRHEGGGSIDVLDNPVLGLTPEHPDAMEFRVSIARAIGAV